MARRALTARRALAVAAVAMAGAALVGCGVPDQGSASHLAPDDVPAALAMPTTTLPPPTTVPATTVPATTVPPPTTRPAPTERVAVWLVRNDRLDPVERTETTLPVTPDRVGALVAAGPVGDERGTGLRTAVRVGDLGRVTLAGGVATVELQPSFAELDGAEQVLAVAQLVLSLTARPGLGRVAFTLGGEALEAPRADGSLGGLTVSRDDYVALIAT